MRQNRVGPPLWWHIRDIVSAPPIQAVDSISDEPFMMIWTRKIQTSKSRPSCPPSLKPPPPRAANEAAHPRNIPLSRPSKNLPLRNPPNPTLSASSSRIRTNN
ncbi:uncharacterized protein LOC103509361 [Diaphorina citri]|uniref:Uncharacterized protein LOC103509361 n=1 Tax=Diaphorina citri TaxID=121845 RepID=A0A1S3D1B9_DIACI|nr:uncharacterized protein LOC103509361 [Diaphorina citri]